MNGRDSMGQRHDTDFRHGTPREAIGRGGIRSALWFWGVFACVGLIIMAVNTGPGATIVSSLIFAVIIGVIVRFLVPGGRAVPLVWAIPAALPGIYLGGGVATLLGPGDHMVVSAVIQLVPAVCGVYLVKRWRF
jgi:hypothetical protein